MNKNSKAAGRKTETMKDRNCKAQGESQCNDSLQACHYKPPFYIQVVMLCDLVLIEIYFYGKIKAITPKEVIK